MSNEPNIAPIEQATPLSVARTIARTLSPAEDSIDRSIADGARLLGAIVVGRLASGIALETGHPAVMDAIRSLASLGDARAHAVSCHRQLADVRDRLNLLPVDTGCTASKPTGQLRPAQAA